MGRRKAYASNPKEGEKEIGKDTIDRITCKPIFEYYDKPQIGERYYIFRTKGEELVGQLVGYPIQNVRRNSSWPLKLQSGEIVEIFANETLHKQLRKCNQFDWLRIVYVGREFVGWGHAKKIFRVYVIGKELI